MTTHTYRGTAGNDFVRGSLHDKNVFSNFGQGQDTLVGGDQADRFVFRPDHIADKALGGGGIDTVDYSNSDRGLDILLGHSGSEYGSVVELGYVNAPVVTYLGSIE